MSDLIIKRGENGVPRCIEHECEFFFSGSMGSGDICMHSDAIENDQLFICYPAIVEDQKKFADTKRELAKIKKILKETRMKGSK